MAEKKIIIKTTPGIHVRIEQASSDWEIRDKDTNKLKQEGKKT